MIDNLSSFRWFGMRIDVVSALFVTVVALSVVPLAGSEYIYIVLIIIIYIYNMYIQYLTLLSLHTMMGATL